MGEAQMFENNTEPIPLPSTRFPIPPESPLLEIRDEPIEKVIEETENESLSVYGFCARMGTSSEMGRMVMKLEERGEKAVDVDANKAESELVDMIDRFVKDISEVEDIRGYKGTLVVEEAGALNIGEESEKKTVLDAIKRAESAGARVIIMAHDNMADKVVKKVSEVRDNPAHFSQLAPLDRRELEEVFDLVVKGRESKLRELIKHKDEFLALVSAPADIMIMVKAVLEDELEWNDVSGKTEDSYQYFGLINSDIERRIQRTGGEELLELLNRMNTAGGIELAELKGNPVYERNKTFNFFREEDGKVFVGGGYLSQALKHNDIDLEPANLLRVE